MALNSYKAKTITQLFLNIIAFSQMPILIIETGYLIREVKIFINL